MHLDDPRLPEFLETQLREHGGKLEIDAGLWLLFAVPVTDGPANSFARELLAEVKFAHHSGTSEDDRWTLYYVDSANRPEALHWLDELRAALAGDFRPVSPAQRAHIRELGTSKMPHRVAQKLAEWHTAGELTAGAIREPTDVRTLLDRLHAMEPLFFAALHTLLSNNLVDLIVLLQQMIPEDVRLKNDIVKAGLSRDPFLQSRQDAAAEIRNFLIRFHVINALDQQKNIAITNPYAAYLEVVCVGETIEAPISGVTVSLPRPHFLDAIRAIRRNLNRGEEFAKFDTQAPWMTREIAHPFRFIRQQLAGHPELSVLDGLYMLERSVEA